MFDFFIVKYALNNENIRAIKIDKKISGLPNKRNKESLFKVLAFNNAKTANLAKWSIKYRCFPNQSDCRRKHGRHQLRHHP